MNIALKGRSHNEAELGTGTEQSTRQKRYNQMGDKGESTSRRGGLEKEGCFFSEVSHMEETKRTKIELETGSSRGTTPFIGLPG